MEPHEEDPVESYKREFMRMRAKRKQQDDENTIRRAERTHTVMRYLTFPVLLFSIILALDKYLPYHVYYETADLGWQEGYRASKYSREYISFMQTPSFVFEVPNHVHIHYPYYEKEKPTLTISVTRIFRFPIHIQVDVNNASNSFDVPGLPVTTYFSWNWLLLITATITVLMKKSSPLTYGMAFVPFVILVVILLSFL